MENLALFKEHYFHELSRRDSLNTSLSFPVTVLGLLLGAIFAMLTKAVEWPHDFADETLIAIVSLSLTPLLFATYYLVRASWGYAYPRIALDTKFLKLQEELIDYFRKKSPTASSATLSTPEELATEEFQVRLAEKYAEASETNYRNNKLKSDFIFKANISISIGIAFVAVSGVDFISLQSQRPSMKVECHCDPLGAIAHDHERTKAGEADGATAAAAAKASDATD